MVSQRLAESTGGGKTDCTLAALHTAAASLAGPGTSLLVGIAPEWATAREPVEPLPEVSSIGIPGQRLQPEGALDELERGRVLERPEIGDARGGEVGDDDDLCDLVIMRSGMVCTWSCQH